MHGSCEWASDEILRNNHEQCGWKGSHYGRRPREKRIASSSEGLDGNQRATVRLLPGGTNHAGGGAIEQQKEADRSRDRRGHCREHLPLRNLSADSCSDQSSGGGNGMSAIENVSRRRFLAGGIIPAGARLGGVRYFPKPSSGDKPSPGTNPHLAT